MSFFTVILFFGIFYFYQFKNIILPFKKITIEDFNGRNTINNIISFNIYTNISMGTPPQIVAHFIEQNQYSFHFKKRQLSYNYNKMSEFIDNMENLTNFWFDREKSSTYIMDNNNGVCSDKYLFYSLNNSEIIVSDFKHNIYSNEINDKYRCGIIGLSSQSDSYLKEGKINFLEELKEKELITDYSFSFLYNEKNDLFNYDKKLKLGTIIIGESPHIYNPDKYKKDDEIINPGVNWAILINEAKFNTFNGNYSENNIEMEFSIITGFIKGTTLYKREIDKLFFSELIENNICKCEMVDENMYPFEYYIYSCENNEKFQKKIIEFPALYFENKNNNLTFIFTYNDLFREFDERIYFMVIFQITKLTSYFPRWTMGEIFLRKYLTTFNYDSKTISFYRSQVNEANVRSQVMEIPKNKSKKWNISKYGRIFFEIIMGLFLIVTLYLLYRKYRISRKIHANELEDSNYIYMPKDNRKFEINKKEKELKKIIY